MAIDRDTLERICNNDPSLEGLDFVFKNLNSSDAALLAGAIKNNHTLTALALGYNNIGDDGATALAGAMKDNNTLAILDLHKNAIGDVGITAVAGVLKGNHTLTKLDLGKNAISDVGAIALANGLKDNSTLTSLNLGNNTIGEVGTAALAHAFIKSKNIVFVDPATEELEAHYHENRAFAGELIEKIQNDPINLTRSEYKEIQERIPAILYFAKWNLNLRQEQIFEMLTSIGIKPALGPATQKVNAAREAQRKAALDDPSQGI